MILPPLVGVLGFVFILGRAGTVNVLLMDWFDMLTPVNFMYGTHGVLLVETLHLFPFMTLSILDSLSKVDPSLEEAAQVVGASGRSEEHTSELQSLRHLVCRLLLEKKTTAAKEKPETFFRGVPQGRRRKP